jgi:hypothetical protein
MEEFDESKIVCSYGSYSVAFESRAEHVKALYEASLLIAATYRSSAVLDGISVDKFFGCRTNAHDFYVFSRKIINQINSGQIK